MQRYGTDTPVLASLQSVTRRYAHLAKGSLRPVMPLIDRTYTFSSMTEGHRYVDTGRKRGNMVVTLDE